MRTALKPHEIRPTPNHIQKEYCETAQLVQVEIKKINFGQVQKMVMRV